MAVSAVSSGYGGDGGPTAGDRKLSASIPPELKEYAELIEKYANEANIDPDLIAAMIWAESRGDENEQSDNADGNVDKGLMQVSSSTAAANGVPGADMSNPEDQIKAGVAEFKNKLDAAGGDIEQALNDYVGGSGIDPNYVANVMAFYRSLKEGNGMSQEDPVPGPVPAGG